MKLWMTTLLSAAVAVSALALPDLADAKRLGGGRSSGMQRDMPARTSPDATPAKPAQPAGQGTAAAPAQNAQAGAAATAGTAAAAAGKRSWMGPLAGLAAGLGLAALASHFGFGEGLANFMLIALLVVGGLMLFAFIRRRMAGGKASAQGPALAAAGVGAGAAGSHNPSPYQASPLQRSATPEAQGSFGSSPSPVAASGRAPVAAAFVPAAFDSEGFARIAKAIFIRMQTANDAGNLDDLRQFTTPEMFAQVKLDLMDRGSAPQSTDVRHVDAKVLDVAEDSGQPVVSVRYTGKIVEEAGGHEQLFDEVWHLVKAPQGEGWLIAGIEQMS